MTYTVLSGTLKHILFQSRVVRLGTKLVRPLNDAASGSNSGFRFRVWPFGRLFSDGDSELRVHETRNDSDRLTASQQHVTVVDIDRPS